MTQPTRTAKRQRVTFWLNHELVRALDAIKEQTGVAKSVQFRRAILAWVVSCRKRTPRVVTTLKDGREIDLTGMSADQAVAALMNACATMDDILHTTHHI